MLEQRLVEAAWRLVAERGVPQPERLAALGAVLDAMETGDMAAVVRVSSSLGMADNQALVVGAYNDGTENAGQIRLLLRAWALVQPEPTGRRRRRAVEPAAELRHVVGE